MLPQFLFSMLIFSDFINWSSKWCVFYRRQIERKCWAITREGEEEKCQKCMEFSFQPFHFGVRKVLQGYSEGQGHQHRCLPTDCQTFCSGSQDYQPSSIYHYSWNPFTNCGHSKVTKVLDSVTFLADSPAEGWEKGQYGSLLFPLHPKMQIPVGSSSAWRRRGWFRETAAH